MMPFPISSNRNLPMAAARGPAREGTTKATVADQIAQAVLSTSNLLHLMQETSPSQAQLVKLPKNLLAKAATVKNTGQVLEQMPRVISDLDAHMENGLHSLPHLQTVIQVLSNMDNSQLNSISGAQRLREDPESEEHCTETTC